MSADSLWDVQTGVFDQLTAATALTALLADEEDSVLDHVPANTPFPYVVISEAQSTPMDTKTSSGNEVIVTLHTYSREAGMREVKEIMAAIYDALHNADFTVPSQTLVLCLSAGSSVVLESDGLTRHGVQSFRIITEPA